ncbi:hypothetical protein SAMN05216474_0960 [Lishizhenia tianjinensis]|uniref:Uncharacterized protein n=1 Tax=Lishizhenia tianjinensis TaxID=477690 RepID=A0A1I6YJZ6_9FLAO|nr:hypothetical protein [Lishizhenia tianjinensis]SFT50800.1 hypothetical protein SAMN05216474_0960 [Lishizhenia tianjinensis]
MSKIFTTSLFLLLTLPLLAFEISREQKTPDFKFEPFERNIHISEDLDAEIRALKDKPQSEWTGQDSLTYGIQLVLLHQYELSLSFILRTHYDTVSNPEKLHLFQESFLRNEAYDALHKSILFEKGDDFNRVLSYRLDVARAMMLLKQGVWDSNTSKMFPEIIRLKREERSKEENIAIAHDLDEALRLFVVHLNRQSNEIVSEAYEEFGDFLLDNFTESNAYIAYSLSRYYYNRNKSVSSKIKEVKSVMDEKHYILPSFRKIFGKIQPGRFNYELLKEKQIEKDSVKAPVVELPKKEKNDLLPKYNGQLIILIGILIILLGVILFVRTKR